MKSFKVGQQQRGAVLVIALVMLLVLTVLAVSNMRGVALESRMTANRAETQRLIASADAALREGEFRLYGDIYIDDKREYNSENCELNNKLKNFGFNKPCLSKTLDPEQLKVFFEKPISESLAEINWMLYRGLDASKEFKFLGKEPESYSSTILIKEEVESNPEYGDVGRGKGNYSYMITGKVGNAVAVQSTVVIVSLGK